MTCTCTCTRTRTYLDVVHDAFLAVQTVGDLLPQRAVDAVQLFIRHAHCVRQPVRRHGAHELARCAQPHTDNAGIGVTNYAQELSQMRGAHTVHVHSI